MRRALGILLSVLVISLVAPAAFGAAAAEETRSGTLYATVTDDSVIVGNALVERTWQRDEFATSSFVDKRSATVAAESAPDFMLSVGDSELPSTLFSVASASATTIDDGLRVTMQLTGPGIDATRTIEIYEGIAGMRTQTTLDTLAPLVLRGYTIEQAAVGNQVAPTLHAFRAGADWREPDWGGPDLAIGDAHSGTWRDTRSAPAGQALAGAGHWLSTTKDGRSLFMVMERNDWPSSRAGYESGTARLNVDYSADIVITGPFEESIHAENPQAGNAPGRHRVLQPGVPYTMEAAFVGFGAGVDDEPWQFYKYLSEHRLDPYDSEITFNSNGTDANLRSDGAKDDMVEEVILETAPIAKRLGVETFILDDGWQARSGDWAPDCGTAPGQPNTDPRWDGTPATAKFRPRYSDCTFQAVRDAIAPMELGLWMSPMHFHPRSSTYMSHPEWACKPSGDVTGGISLLQPSGGSNDAGLGTWSAMPQVITHVESRIQNAIDNWGVTYFKFDFLVWLDCAGQNDLYEYKERFIGMLDRLIEANPEVTFQIDETNDYRLFPFESVTRSPSWFQNGSPPPDRLLHNLWNLSPYVPTSSLGQHFLGGNQYRNFPVDTLMAISLPGHLTFFSDLRNVPLDVVDQARPWTNFYAANRDHFTQMTYPLLADPLEKEWTALQTWNPDDGKGALLAFRQQSADSTKTVSLRNVPPGMTFDLFEGPSGALVGTVTSDQLAAGLEITIPATDGARVLLIEPAEQDAFDPATTLTYSGDTSARKGAPINLSAALVGSDGPVSGALIEFVLAGRSFTATTDGAGIATTIVSPKLNAGSYEVVTSYLGSDQYSPSSDRAPFTITNGKPPKTSRAL